MVDLAVSSVALAIFSRTHHHPPAAREAFSQYGRLLRVVQAQIMEVDLQEHGEKGVDESLLTIALMAWYETAMHQSAYLKSEHSYGSLHSWSHHIGATAILKVWNDTLAHNPPSRIIKHVRRGMVRSALLRDCPLPEWLRDGSRFGEHSLDLGFDAILVRLANLRHRYKGLRRRKELHTAEAEELTTEAHELNEACREWAMQVPNSWSYEVHIIAKGDSLVNEDFPSPTVFTYARPGYAAVWMQYFAARMIIDSTRLGLLQSKQPLQLIDVISQRQHQEFIAGIREMAHNIASTVPFSFGGLNVDTADGSGPIQPDGCKRNITLNSGNEIRPSLALPVVWPLAVISGLEGIEPKQRVWVLSQLARLGRVLGDGALESASGGQ